MIRGANINTVLFDEIVAAAEAEDIAIQLCGWPTEMYSRFRSPVDVHRSTVSHFYQQQNNMIPEKDFEIACYTDGLA